MKNRAETGISRWWPPLPSAMNTRRSPNRRSLQPQPEDLAAAQPAQHHRRDHRPVPVRAQRGGQRVDLGRVQDPRQRPGQPGPAGHPGRGRCRSRRVGRPRGTGFTLTSPRASRNPYSPDTLDSRRRSVRADTPPAPGPATCRRPSPPVRCAVMNASTSAGADPPRRLADHGEEDLQVIRHRQHRVRPAPARQELQVLIQQPAPPAAPPRSPAAFRDRVRRTAVTGMQASISIRTGLSACQDPYEDHPHIMHERAA